MKSLSLFLSIFLTYSYSAFCQISFGNDVTIKSESGINQRDVVVTSAFNGWLFSAYTTVNTAANAGGITILRSTDNGFTWDVIDSYIPSDVRYLDVEIEVVGSDTSSMKLFVFGLRNNVGSGTYVAFLDTYKASTGQFLGSPFNRNTGTRAIYDIDISTDFLNPAVGSSPYSVGLLYSISGPSRDSVIFYSSIDGGATFNNKRVLTNTSYYLRDVTLAYGKSNSGSNGRYFAAWEQLSTISSRNGNVFYSRCQSTVDGSWITPINIDSISSAAAGLTRNPRIACSISNTDTDSGGVSVVILMDRDYMGSATDYDVIGFYNQRSHFTNYFFRLDIDNSSSNSMHSDIVYNHTDSVFSVVYMDSVAHQLKYTSKNFNIPDPYNWNTISSTINDNPTITRNAFPRISWCPNPEGVAIVWSDEGPGGDGVAKFDAEYFNLFVSTPVEASQTFKVVVYPNPTTDWINLKIESIETSEINVQVLDISGRLIEQSILQVNSGSTNHTINVASFPAGNYFIRTVVNGETYTQKIVVTH